jgi:general stress protein YciG
MAQIGRRGGEAVSGDREHMAQIGRKGGEARGER